MIGFNSSDGLKPAPHRMRRLVGALG
jgi:hypothetical protein